MDTDGNITDERIRVESVWVGGGGGTGGSRGNGGGTTEGKSGTEDGNCGNWCCCRCCGRCCWGCWGWRGVGSNGCWWVDNKDRWEFVVTTNGGGTVNNGDTEDWNRVLPVRLDGIWEVTTEGDEVESFGAEEKNCCWEVIAENGEPEEINFGGDGGGGIKPSLLKLPETNI